MMSSRRILHSERELCKWFGENYEEFGLMIPG